MIINNSGMDIQSISASRADRLTMLTGRMKMCAETKNIFGTAAILYTIHNERLYLEAGYKNISQYGHDMLGYKAVTINNYVWIAKNYLDLNTGRSIFAKGNKDIGYTTILELRKITPKEAIALYEAGEFSVDSTVHAVRAVVAAFIAKRDKDRAEAAKAEKEPLESAYEAFHTAYNELKQYLTEKGDIEAADKLLPKIMDAVVVVYVEATKEG